MHRMPNHLLFGISVLVTTIVGLPLLERNQICTCAPGDPCWPSARNWQAFNETLRGLLISTVPLAEVCYNPIVKNGDLCMSLKDEWLFAPIQ